METVIVLGKALYPELNEASTTKEYAAQCRFKLPNDQPRQRRICSRAGTHRAALEMPSLVANDNLMQVKVMCQAPLHLSLVHLPPGGARVCLLGICRPFFPFPTAGTSRSCSSLQAMSAHKR